MPTNDAPHRRIPFRVRLRGRYFHPPLRPIGTSELPGAIPTDLLPVGVDFQPPAGREDEQVQRHTYPGRYLERFCQGKGDEDHFGRVQELDREARRSTGGEGALHRYGAVQGKIDTLVTYLRYLNSKYEIKHLVNTYSKEKWKIIYIEKTFLFF